MIIVLDNIRSIFNVGSIFRTADAVGAEKVVVCGYTPGPDNQLERLTKTSLGAEEHILWERHGQTWRYLDILKKEGYRIVALENTKAAENLYEVSIQEPVALVLGNEVKGVAVSVLSRADRVVQIPMHGFKKSLNVAVAMGVAAYQLMNASG